MLIDPASRFAGGLSYSTYPAFEQPATDRFERALLADSRVFAGHMAMQTAVWPHLYTDLHGVPPLSGMWAAGPATPSKPAAPVTPSTTAGRCRIPAPRSGGAPSTSAVARVVPEAIRSHVLTLLKQADCWAISKGRYTQHIRQFLQLVGIDLPDPAQATRGICVLDGRQHEFAYMKDAAIPRFVASGEGHLGFAGSHQVVGTMANLEPDASIEYLGVVRLPRARFALAVTDDEKRRSIIERKLAHGEAIRGCTEYPAAGRDVARVQRLNLVLSDSAKGMAETDAAENRCVDTTLAIVSSGKTLRDNALRIVDGWDDLMPIWINAVWNLPETPAALQRQADALRSADLEDMPAPGTHLHQARSHWVPSSNAIAAKDTVAIAPRGSAFAAKNVLALVGQLLRDTPGWALPKGLHESCVLHLLAALGIDLPQSARMKTGWHDAHRFWYLRDAAIPRFVSEHQGRMGFAAGHQVFEANAGLGLNVIDLPVLSLPAARFVLAVPAGKSKAVERKIAAGECLRLYCEYPMTGSRIANRYGWTVELLRSDEDMAEFDAAKDDDADGALTIVSELDRTAPNGLQLVRDGLQPVRIHAVWNPVDSMSPHRD
jgi:ATP phosphoribosyltransferase